MQKNEKIIGAIIAILIISRLLFHFPFFNTSILLLSLILSCIYFVLSFALLNNIRLRNIFKNESYKDISILRMIGVVCTGVVLSIVTIYSLFKFMIWPMGNEGLIIGLITLFIPLVIVTVKLIITKSKFYTLLLIRLLIFTIIGSALYFIPTQTIKELKSTSLLENINTKQ